MRPPASSGPTAGFLARLWVQLHALRGQVKEMSTEITELRQATAIFQDGLTGKVTHLHDRLNPIGERLAAIEGKLQR